MTALATRIADLFNHEWPTTTHHIRTETVSPIRVRIKVMSPCCRYVHAVVYFNPKLPFGTAHPAGYDIETTLPNSAMNLAELIEHAEVVQALSKVLSRMCLTDLIRKGV